MNKKEYQIDYPIISQRGKGKAINETRKKEYQVDYPVIDKACNGVFLQHEGKWRLLFEITGRCYNHGEDIQAERGKLVLENSDQVDDQLVVSRETFDKVFIDSLEVDTFRCTWGRKG